MILQIAQDWLEEESKELKEAKAAYMAEHCPAPDLRGDQAAMMVRHLHLTNRKQEILFIEEHSVIIQQVSLNIPTFDEKLKLRSRKGTVTYLSVFTTEFV